MAKKVKPEQAARSLMLLETLLSSEDVEKMARIREVLARKEAARLRA